MSEVTAASEAVLEPPCEACIRAGGLCHKEECRHRILPELKEPSWPSLIGEGYTCDGKTCGQGEHLACLDKPEIASPRAGCECHSCAQRRAALKHLRAQAKADPVVAKKQASRVKKAIRRNIRKSQRCGVSGLRHSLMGGKSPRGPMRSVV